MRWNWSRTLASGLAVFALAGCAKRFDVVPPLRPDWRAVPLPAAGATVREVTACHGSWLVVGAVDTTPAAWTSTDGQTWRAVSLRPISHYGARGGFTAVACRGADVVAISSAVGGMHGNPRVSTWRGTTSGGWDEMPAPFELFGGPYASDVGRVVSGPAGWLIVGHRISPATRIRGAAVWFSPDGRGFRLIDDDAALRSSGESNTSARDAVPKPDGGWVLIGSEGTATAPRPAVWASNDGLRWRRTDIEAVNAGQLDRAAPFHRSGLIALGGGYSWLVDQADGERLDQLGLACTSGLPASALATANTAAGQTAFVAAGDGMCASPDGYDWREVIGPGAIGSGAVRSGAVGSGAIGSGAVGSGAIRSGAGDGSRLLFASVDRLWIADVATLAV